MAWVKTLPPAAIASAATMAMLLVMQIVCAIRLDRKLRATVKMTERLERLAAALNLLTDTTEGGLAALTSEIDRIGRRVVVPAPKDHRRPVLASDRERDDVVPSPGDDRSSTSSFSSSSTQAHVHVPPPVAAGRPGDRYAHVLG
jgi:hypothetical protein